MAATDVNDLALRRRAIALVRPDLADAALEEVGIGWDCAVVMEADTVFRFPRHAEAARRLVREPPVLALVAAHAPVAVPRLVLHWDAALPAGVFSEHRRIPGTMMDPAAYDALDDETRELLAADLASTYAALHRIPLDEAAGAGAGPVGRWADAAETFVAVRDVLDPPLLSVAARVLGAAGSLPDDDTVFGHFDTHGWNMAFDRERGRLGGLFDFGDSGTGPLHRDLSYPCFVAPDLAARVVRRYRTLSRREVRLERVFTLHTVLRLVEIAGAPAAEKAKFVWMLTDWLAALSRFRGDSLGHARGGHAPGGRAAARAAAARVPG